MFIRLKELIDEIFNNKDNDEYVKNIIFKDNIEEYNKLRKMPRSLLIRPAIPTIPIIASRRWISAAMIRFVTPMIALGAYPREP